MSRDLRLKLAKSSPFGTPATSRLINNPHQRFNPGSFAQFGLLNTHRCGLLGLPAPLELASRAHLQILMRTTLRKGVAKSYQCLSMKAHFADAVGGLNQGAKESIDVLMYHDFGSQKCFLESTTC
jgi:hypothetical protein